MNMTVKLYCERSGLSKDQLYNLINAHGFPAIRVGTRYIVNDGEADKWFRENQGRFLKGVQRKG